MILLKFLSNFLGFIVDYRRALIQFVLLATLKLEFGI